MTTEEIMLRMGELDKRALDESETEQEQDARHSEWEDLENKLIARGKLQAPTIVLNITKLKTFRKGYTTMGTHIERHKQELRLLSLLDEAKNLIFKDKEDESLSFDKAFLDKVEKLYNDLLTFRLMTAPEEVASQYNYTVRYFAETLCISGRIKSFPFGR